MAADKPAPALPPLTVKLDPTKYPLWLAQIIPFLNSSGLMSFVDGTAMCPPAFLLDADGKPTNTTNPDYDHWIQMDQFVLSLINGSLSHFVVATLEGSLSARATWVALEALLLGAEQQVPTPMVSVSDHSTAAAAASPGCGFDHVASGGKRSGGGGGGGGGGTTGEGVSGKKGLPGVKFFFPTEQELVGYLTNQIEGKDSEFRDLIPVIDNVCEREPRDLPAFFFSQPDYKYKNSKRCNRSTDEGFYKSTGKVREIKAEQSQAVIGNKRILSYYEGRAPQAKKTKHVMHEYSLTQTKLAQLGAQNNQQRELVLCHLTNKSAKSAKLKDDSICGDELAEPAIVGEIAYSKDVQAAATDMIQGPDEHLKDKDALLGTENRNECAEPSCADLGENMDSTFLSPEQLAATSATTPTSATSFGGFGVGSPDGFFLSDIDDLLKQPSCADLGENMDSTFLSPEQLAATSATTPTSATSFGGFGVGSPDGFLLPDIDDMLKQPSCADLGENMDLTFLPPEQQAATSATTPTSATSFGGFGVGSPDGFLLSDIDDLLKQPSCADLGENMDSTFLPPEQLAATSATTPTSATSFGGFGAGSPDGFLLPDIDDLLKEPFCADQPHQPPPAPHPHQPPPAPHPHQPPPAPQSHQPPSPSQPQNYCFSTLPSALCTKQGNVPSLYNDDCSRQLSPTGNPPHPHQPPPAPHPHQPPPPSQPQNYCSSTLPSALCTKQGNVPSLYNDDCSKQLSPTGNNVSTNYHHEPVSNTAYSIQNGATDERFSEVYKISTNDHNESVSSEAYFQPEENLGILHPFRPQDYTLLSPRNTELGDFMHANNYIDMQW
ncbi:PREDICTED: uncharacterized protein LOC103342394 [Prunus mume]|uniref:Uncharacterized protein LOC103342394 n=1 Tax=Prunus mume TaxID=102107 RepID=A0ABM0PTI0_PRUMU|nr:PREDICTED: uncharacterized protein LOC103342394 [Prunus mume]